MTSSVQIYRIFEGKKDTFTPDEAMIIASALERKDNAVTKDDLYNGLTDIRAALNNGLTEVRREIHRMDIKLAVSGAILLFAILANNPKIMDFIGKLWTVFPR